jgi:S-adenosyl methyltransferase
VSSPDAGLMVAVQRWNRISPMTAYVRDRDEIASWFRGLDLVEPGAVEILRWRPAPNEPDYPAGVPLLGVVTRKR